MRKPHIYFLKSFSINSFIKHNLETTFNLLIASTRQNPSLRAQMVGATTVNSPGKPN